jgi:hypothetical protein
VISPLLINDLRNERLEQGTTWDLVCETNSSGMCHHCARAGVDEGVDRSPRGELTHNATIQGSICLVRIAQIVRFNAMLVGEPPFQWGQPQDCGWMVLFACKSPILL